MSGAQRVEDEAPAGEPEAVPARPLLLLPVAALAWAVATAVFLLLRLAPIWETPVGGAELTHLAGAWQARLGVGDGRFAPTLFEAITAGLLHLSSSEVPARVLAFLATGTIPLALHRLRPQLGEAGALVALVLVAFDAPAIWLGVSASAMGFDLAVTLWLFVVAVQPPARPWSWALVAFFVASAGPLALPLAAGWVAVAGLRRQYPPAPAALFAAAGVAVAVILTTLRYGLGGDGLRVAPFDLFSAGFDERWSTATAGEMLMLYGLPFLVGGIVAAGVALVEWQRGHAPSPATRLLLVWSAFSAAWLIAASATNQDVPTVALTLPLALLLGPALARAAMAMFAADWRVARVILPLAGLAVLLIFFVVVRWARADAVGAAGDQAKVWVYALVFIACLVAIGYQRESRAALLPAALVPGGLLLIFGASGVAFSSANEPLPSPASPVQARDLRDIALQQAQQRGGAIVVNPAFADAITWPFRDSGDIVIASRVPQEAAVVIWPPGLPKPDGFVPLEGNWSLTSEVVPPTGGVLDYLHWLIDRHRLPTTSQAVAVYLKAGP